MQWMDEGIVLSIRTHGETAVIVDLWTRGHGRHMGLVCGGQSRRLRPVLQAGNHIDAIWKARLADQLGSMSVELRRAFAAETLDDAQALMALSSITTLAGLLPERDPHPNLYEITLFVLGFLNDATVWPALLIRWELTLLDELGFGLDLNQCAATGANDQLIYVSPKSGCAVSALAGEPYRDKLLALPQFLTKQRSGSVTVEDVNLGFALTGYFIEKYLLLPKGQILPTSRMRLVAQFVA